MIGKLIQSWWRVDEKVDEKVDTKFNAKIDSVI